jgi:protein-disulfide isomerase
MGSGAPHQGFVRLTLNPRAVTSRDTLSVVLAWTLLLASLSGCRNKNKPAATLSQEQGRRIERVIRSQYDIPGDYELKFGLMAASQVTGYDDLPVTFSHNGKQVKFTFLLSRDAKHLARLQDFDLTKDPSSAIPFDSRKVVGDLQGKVTVVVFDDLECPYCARFHSELFPDTVEHYKRGVRLVYNDFPLTEVHPWAMHAAVNAGCLASQSTSAYWHYVDNVHRHYAEFRADKQHLQASLERLDQLAKQETGIDQKVLDVCVGKQDESAVRDSLTVGKSLGVESTPTVFINGERMVGARPTAWLWASVDRALKSQGVEPPVPTDAIRTDSLQTKARESLH